MDGKVMADEMASQPVVLARLAARAAADQAAVRALIPDPLAGIVLLARGSSDNAAVFGRYLAELAAGRPAGLAAPSLYTRYHASVDWHGYLVIALSQSGFTPEIVTACRAMRSAGATTIGITNDASSPLADTVHLALATDAGPERAIPATKTVTAQLMLMITVTAALGTDPAIIDSLAAAPGAASMVLGDPEPVRELALACQRHDRLVVVGRGLAYAAALETALKVKETTGILAEGMSSADLLHGPISVAYAGTPVLLIDIAGPTAPDLAELRRLLEARQTAVAVMPLSAGVAALPEAAQVIAAVIRGQQLARQMALAAGTDPDQPDGLSKVTATS